MKSCNELLLFPLSYFDFRWGPKNGLNARSPLNKSFCCIRECFLKALANSAHLEQSLEAVWPWSTMLAVSEYLG